MPPSLCMVIQEVTEIQNTEITLTVDGERLDALEFYLKKENTTVQKRMNEALTELYERTVPEEVREYIDRKTVPTRPKRTTKPNRAPQPAVAHVPEFRKEEL